MGNVEQLNVRKDLRLVSIILICSPCLKKHRIALAGVVNAGPRTEEPRV